MCTFHELSLICPNPSPFSFTSAGSFFLALVYFCSWVLLAWINLLKWTAIVSLGLSAQTWNPIAILRLGTFFLMSESSSPFYSVVFSCQSLPDPAAHRLRLSCVSLSMGIPAENVGVGCHFLLKVTEYLFHWFNCFTLLWGYCAHLARMLRLSVLKKP